jgi:transcriptional regulator GlxA family with amidase domain
VAGLCSGAFVLAAAGLLDGRPATTHWALAGQLAQMYPKVEVRPDRLYVDDGDVLTAGGGAAGMDLRLHLLREHCGAAVANRLARYTVVHVTQVFSFPSGDPAEFEGLSEPDMAALGKLQWFMDLVQWTVHPEPGGHYAAHLEPDVLADDIRAFYAGRR